MTINNFENFSKINNSKIFFNYDLKKTNWFNIGGKAKVFFKPENLSELVAFLKEFGKSQKIFILGAGSNILLSDNKFDGVVIKLGKKFTNISLLKDQIIIAGSGVIDKKLSEFACNNGIGGFEFLSCIPGTVGGGLKMNSGCFKKEFKDILLSVQAIDKSGRVLTIPSSKIKFGYRESNLDDNLIFLSASFKGKPKNKKEIENQINFLKKKKDETQPTKIKTGGSTFKNPIDQTNKKVWELIKECVPSGKSFGEAKISTKHCNFFINEKNASFNDMKNLIEFVKKKVKIKTGIKLETEIKIIE